MPKFDPQKYLKKTPDRQDEKTNTSKTQTNPLSHDDYNKVKEVVSQLETLGIDITASYDNWIKIGFAFADAFGSMGEALFHSVSSNYPEYDAESCRKQYQKCLDSTNSGATLGTFFHLAKEAGVTPSSHKQKVYTLATSQRASVAQEEPEEEQITQEQEPSLPVIPSSVYKLLPKFLEEVTKCAARDQERDLLLLGSLTVMSSCLPNVYGMYDQNIVYPNLFLFVTAPASSGKGRINLCRKLVYPIHKQKRDATNSQKVQYEVELSEYYDLKKTQKGSTPQKPEEPRDQMLFLPANNSATGAFELLANNDGKGLIFETEGDTLAQAFKSEHGNYSDGFRKAFHHEEISYYRRTASEYVDIKSPQLSAVLSGTPDQVLSLMPDSENGLFSRFIFYKMQRQKQWKNVFANTSKESLDSIFDELGDQYLKYYQILEGFGSGIKINLREHQIEQFNAFFSKEYDKFLFLQKTGLEASLFRLGLICYRMAMIFTIIRSLENNSLTNILHCQDIDMENAITIVESLLNHTQIVYRYLPEKKQTLPKIKNLKESFLDELTTSFSTQKYKSIANKLKIPEKTSERYIKQFVEKGYLQRIGHGQYLHGLKKEG
ncbi:MULTISPECIES: DUF3987 domain-containing protein [Aquimarina]|uniref:DUF3987 domain-containing protein n=1 Tax=Aquimarina TaxID=290174 RepID=UPI0004143BCD|nr:MULTISPECIES: DUF3987 domain-containing protein [Aquimarina]